LWPGYNRITATTLDAIGQESGESPPTEIYLDDALNIVTLPNPPIGIDAKQVANGDIVVTVWVDDTVTGIKIYHDAHDGSVDYGTVIQSVAVTPTGSVTAVIVTLSAGLTDGDYIIAARSVNGVNVEDNTDVVVLITRDTSASAQATSLVAEVVQ